MNSQVFELVCPVLDDLSLCLLGETCKSLLSLLSHKKEHNHFWKRRVELLVPSSTLPELCFSSTREEVVENWRQVHKDLSVALRAYNQFTDEVLTSTTLTKILLQDKRADPTRSYVTRSIGRPFSAACGHGHLEVVKLLLSDPRVNPDADKGCAFIEACRQGHLEVVKLLLSDPRVNPLARQHLAFLMACDSGHIEIVRFLLGNTQVDPGARPLCLINACKYGYLDIVSLLLRDGRVDPSCVENSALILACRNGHTKIVRLLLDHPQVDPSAREEEPLISACANGHAGVVRVLLADGRANPRGRRSEALTHARTEGYTKIIQILILSHEIRLREEGTEK